MRMLNANLGGVVRHPMVTLGKDGYRIDRRIFKRLGVLFRAEILRDARDGGRRVEVLVDMPEW
jgi:hypothetical protein